MNRKRQSNIPELMIPVGDINTLEYAIAYGADSVYLGGKKFNLRSLGKNFSVDGIKAAVDLAHDNDVKLYFTLNSIVTEKEIGELKDYLNEIKEIEIDAFIISDTGVARVLKELIPESRLHISTQANVVNHYGVEFWKDFGASRVNLARELSFSEVKKIKDKTDIEIEVFVHGALCISYSGRCMLSKYMAGRDANKGECAHSCRWKYYLMEEERPNMFYPVIQDSKGSYIYNSRDLCLIKRVDSLLDAEIDCLKVEGRMKTENYISQVTWAYRRALEYSSSGKYDENKKDYLFSQLGKITHRNYTEGFMFSKDGSSLSDNDNVGYIKGYTYIGKYISHDDALNGPLIYVKNQFFTGDEIDVLQPGINPKKIKPESLIENKTNKSLECANPNDTVILKGAGKMDRFSIFRVKAS